MTEQGMQQHRDEVAIEATEAQKRLQAIREQKLTTKGTPWQLEHFSPPGEVAKCEHIFLRKMVLGGANKYFCDDCEYAFILPQAFAQPKQHIVANALMELAWVMHFDGPEAVAMQLQRPHIRLDKEGHPSEAPLELLREYKDQFKQCFEILAEYEQKRLANGNGHKELTDGDTMAK